jgi:Dehydrogenases with different specificities (related to short-chain alcohol dehydrogenases)
MIVSMKKVALITGSARRLGREFALFMADSGWNIALHYHHSAEDASLLLHELRSRHHERQFELFNVDLSDVQSVEYLIPDVIKRMGRLDLIINNASVFEQGRLAETSAEKIRHHLAVNLEAPLLLMGSFVKSDCSGLIVNLLDSRIDSNLPSHFAYSLSKKGLAEATRMAAVEFAPKIRVNGLALGALFPPEGKDEKYLAGVAAKSPMQKPTGVNSILHTLTFLLENESVTGEVIFCDGGMSLL